MVIAIAGSCLLLLGVIYNIFRSIREKKWLDVISGCFMRPFFFFSLVYAILGGSAFNDAATDYALYEAGHHYLFDHGYYTEVSLGQFQFMYIVEIIGIGGFFVAFVFAILNATQSKKNSKATDSTSQ